MCQNFVMYLENLNKMKRALYLINEAKIYMKKIIYLHLSLNIYKCNYA